MNYTVQLSDIPYDKTHWRFSVYPLSPIKQPAACKGTTLLKPGRQIFRGVTDLQKVKFVVGRDGRLVGSIAGIPCIVDSRISEPKAGETWLVEITRTSSRRTLFYVRPVRQWMDTPEDRRSVVHAHVDYRNGTVCFHNRFVLPIEKTTYAKLWDDYNLLVDNVTAVIIKGDTAVRWNKKGKPPQVLPLHRFATKYRRQPLLGEPKDIHRFLANLEELRSQTIQSTRVGNKGAMRNSANIAVVTVPRIAAIHGDVGMVGDGFPFAGNYQVNRPG